MTEAFEKWVRSFPAGAMLSKETVEDMFYAVCQFVKEVERRAAVEYDEQVTLLTLANQRIDKEFLELVSIGHAVNAVIREFGLEEP